MTRLLTTGYETGDIAEAGTSVIGTGAALSVVSTAPAPRAGAYCLKCAATGTSVTSTYKQFVLATSKTEVWVRFAFFDHPASTGVHTFATLADSAGVAQTGLRYEPSTGNILAVQASFGTTLATSSATMSVDTWHIIDWRVQITSTTVGAVEVWLDGTRVINFSGDNTATVNANVQGLWLGCLATALGSATGWYDAFDDIAINDVAGTANNGRMGDGRVVLLIPTGPGSVTQLTRGGTDSGANWSQVDELPPSLTDYVYGSTVGNRDLYAMSDLPVTVQSINVVEAVALAQNSDAGGGSLGLTLKSSATVNEAAPVGLTTTAAYVIGRWETDPNTSAAWTATAVNAAEAGATVR